MDEQTVAQKNNTVYILIAAVVVLVIGVIMATLAAEKGPAKTGSNQDVPSYSPTPSVIGTMNLTTTGGVTRVPQTTPVILNVTADSAGQQVVGFDVVVSYDPTQFDYVGVKSLVTGFTAQATAANGVVAVTGIKPLTTTEPTAFAGEEVVALTFRPKAPGTARFAVELSRGRATTKFVNESTQILTPATSALSVEVF